MRLCHSCLALGLLLATLLPVRAEQPPDPLRLVPDKADLFIEIPQPRALVQRVAALPALAQLRQFDAVRELFDSTNARRGRQLVAYYEKALGLPWPELLDRLAGGGIVLAVKFAPDPAPVLLVIQSKDEALLKRFTELALKILEQETARQESPAHVVKGKYHGVATVELGKEFHAAVVGGALLVSNSGAALHLAVDQHAAGDRTSLARAKDVAAARKLLPAGPLVWLWSSTRAMHKLPQAKEVFTLPRNDAILTVAFGGLLDVLGRAPFVCGSLSEADGQWLLTARLPRGRAGMSPALSTHAPPSGQPGSLPLLEPPGVLLSECFYVDIGKFWNNRYQLFNAKQVKTFEQFDQNTGKFLLGHRFSQLTNQMGPYQRFVIANTHDRGYQKAPDVRLPAFGVVVSMRDPAFGKTMEGIIRAGALLAGFRVKLKLVTEDHDGYKLVGYRFVEDAPLPSNLGNVVFNFTPCFVAIGDQFAVCSTMELGRQLIPLLDREKRQGRKSSPAFYREKIFASGGAELLANFKDRLLAQIILSQAMPAEAAQQQVQDLIDWVRHLGTVRLGGILGQHSYRVNIEFRPEQRARLTQQRPAAKAGTDGP